MFLGPSSRAIDCATARNPNLALANAAKPDPPRRLAVAPVKKILPLPRGKHQTRRLPAGEKTGIAGHLPNFAENPLGRIDDRKIHIGADVEDANLQRSMLVRVTQKGHDLVLLSRVERPSEHFAARRLDFLDQRRELLALTAPDEDRETLGRKFLGDLAADKVSGADNGYGCVSFFQGFSPEREDVEIVALQQFYSSFLELVKRYRSRGRVGIGT